MLYSRLTTRTTTSRESVSSEYETVRTDEETLADYNENVDDLIETRVYN